MSSLRDSGNGARVEPVSNAPDDGQTFWQKGKLSFSETVREAVNYRALRQTPYGLSPVLAITALGALAAFQAGIFGLALPDIVRALDVNVFSLFQVSRLIALAGVVSIIGIAYYADRRNRVRLVGFGAIGAGVFGLGLSRSANLTALGISLLGASESNIATTTAMAPMLADYYPPFSRGKVYALSGVLAGAIDLATPILVALFVSVWGWQSPYLLSGPLLILVGVFFLVRLKEPIRGYMERKAMGAPEEVAVEAEEPPSLGEAFRTVWAIRTMRRLFIAAIPDTLGIYIYGFFFSVFFFERYGLDITQRAFLYVASAAATLPAGFLAGGVVDVLLKRRPQRVLVFSGLLGVVAAVFLMVIATGPPLWVVVVMFVLFGAASAFLGPARNVLYVNIVPAHVRTLGTAMIQLAVIPATIAQFFIIGAVERQFGIQGALMASAPAILIGALISLTAAGLYERDMRSAFASQLASEEYRRAKKTGRGKMLVCRDVDVEYDGVQVLFGVDFDVEEGEFIAVLGTNGAGKSTLLRAISGTQEASSGAIVFDGRDITHMPPSEIAARGIVHVPGGRGVFPGLTVRECLMLGGWSEEAKDRTPRLEEVLRLFPILQQRFDQRAGLLSGGEQQMLSLAQALLSQPRVLIIDELSMGLSPAVVSQLIDVVRKVNEQGTTVILVEQSVNIALTVAKRAIFMEKGEVKFVGDADELLRRPDILRAVYVKGTGALSEGSTSPTVMSERERRMYRLSQSRSILQVRDVGKRYGGVVALEEVSFELREGEILGLIGPNGAGKTTLFDIIGGQETPDSGHVIFDGTEITSLSASDLASRRLIRRFQDARLFPSLTVFENILMALDRKIEARNMVFVAMQLPQVRQAERKVRLRAEGLIALLKLEAYRDKFVKELSTGLRRIVDLAFVLASEPKLLLLDEPSTGIAQAESENLGPLLRRVRFETGCSMLVIEHDMTLISSIADELMAMERGKVITRGSPDDVLNDDRVIESYLGTTQETIQRSGLIETPR